MSDFREKAIVAARAVNAADRNVRKAEAVWGATATADSLAAQKAAWAAREAGVAADAKAKAREVVTRMEKKALAAENEWKTALTECIAELAADVDVAFRLPMCPGCRVQNPKGGSKMSEVQSEQQTARDAEKAKRERAARKAERKAERKAFDARYAHYIMCSGGSDE